MRALAQTDNAVIRVGVSKIHHSKMCRDWEHRNRKLFRIYNTPHIQVRHREQKKQSSNTCVKGEAGNIVIKNKNVHKEG